MAGAVEDVAEEVEEVVPCVIDETNGIKSVAYQNLDRPHETQSKNVGHCQNEVHFFVVKTAQKFFMAESQTMPVAAIWLCHMRYGFAT